MEVNTKVLHQPMISDHNIMICEFNTFKNIQSKIRKSFNRGKINYDNIKNKLDMIDWKGMFIEGDIHNKYNIFFEDLTSALNEIAPKKEVIIRDRKMPWICEEIMNVIKTRDYFYNRHKLVRKEEDWIQYKIYRNRVVKLLKREEKKVFRENDRRQ